jgi:hypothetical protein
MSSRRAAVLSYGFLLLILVAACGEPAAPAKINIPVSLTVLSGDGQTALEYTELPLPIVVQILNAKGKPVQGQMVNFRVVQGGGSVYAGAAFTDAQGIAREWWTLGSAALRNLLEARVVDPATGAPLLLGSVVNIPQPLDNPRIQFKCGNQADWVPPNTGPGPGECYGTGPVLPDYDPGNVIQMQVRVIHGPDNAPVPVTRMWLDFYAFHNSDTGTPPSVTPLYAVTNISGVTTLAFTIGSQFVANELVVYGPSEFFSRLPVVEGIQPFRVVP